VRRRAERLRLLATPLGELVRGRIPDANARIDAAQLDLTELWVHGASPGAKDARGVVLVIPARQALQIGATEAIVVLDEALGPWHSQAREQIPELDHVADGAALLVRIFAQVAVQRLVGLVQELFVARDGRVFRVLERPLFDLAEQRQVGGLHLVVWRVPEWADQHATVRVQVEPGKISG
jgi:hypothetical protein